MTDITLILGGARSGKSRRGLELADLAPKRFVATAEALDQEMAERISHHQDERGAEWGLVEVPIEIAEVIQAHEQGSLLIDCLTLWLSNLLHYERDVETEIERMIGALEQSQARIVLVSNEVGLSIAPENALARRFRDLQGRLNQRVAAVADRVEFVAAGLPMVLKG